MCLDTMFKEPNMPVRALQAYTGDAARYNSSGSEENSAHQFNIDNKMKVEAVEHTRLGEGNERKFMLTLINVVLGARPINEGWRLWVGLYLTPTSLRATDRCEPRPFTL